MISSTNYKLLQKIMHHNTRASNRLFDKRDNTFLKSNRQIAKILGVPASNIDRLFRECKQKDLVRRVSNIYKESCYMLNPLFLFYNHKMEKPLAVMMYKAGSYDKAIEYRQYCVDNGVIIDIESGEVIRAFNWDFVDNYANSYCRYDVNSRSD